MSTFITFFHQNSHFLVDFCTENFTSNNSFPYLKISYHGGVYYKQSSTSYFTPPPLAPKFVSSINFSHNEFINIYVLITISSYHIANLNIGILITPSPKKTPFKGVLHLLPKISMFCALSQNNQQLFEK